MAKKIITKMKSAAKKMGYKAMPKVKKMKVAVVKKMK